MMDFQAEASVSGPPPAANGGAGTHPTSATAANDPQSLELLPALVTTDPNSSRQKADVPLYQRENLEQVFEMQSKHTLRFADPQAEQGYVAFISQRQTSFVVTALLIGLMYIAVPFINIELFSRKYLWLALVNVITALVILLLCMAIVLISIKNVLKLPEQKRYEAFEILSSITTLVFTTVLLADEGHVERCMKEDTNPHCDGQLQPSMLAYYFFVPLFYRPRSMITIPIYAFTLALNAFGRVLANPGSPGLFWMRWGVNAAMAVLGMFFARYVDARHRHHFRIMTLAEGHAYSVRNTKAVLEATLNAMWPETVVKDVLNHRIALTSEDVAAMAVVDLKNFVEWSNSMLPMIVAQAVCSLHTRFDLDSATVGLTKYSVTGDRYAAGTPIGMPLTAAHRIYFARRAAEFAAVTIEHTMSLNGFMERPLEARSILHAGPLLAMAVGTKSLSYEALGPSMTMAIGALPRVGANRIAVSGAAEKVLRLNDYVRHEIFDINDDGFSVAAGQGDGETEAIRLLLRGATADFLRQAFAYAPEDRPESPVVQTGETVSEDLVSEIKQGEETTDDTATITSETISAEVTPRNGVASQNRAVEVSYSGDTIQAGSSNEDGPSVVVFSSRQTEAEPEGSEAEEEADDDDDENNQERRRWLLRRTNEIAESLEQKHHHTKDHGARRRSRVDEHDGDQHVAVKKEDSGVASASGPEWLTAVLVLLDDPLSHLVKREGSDRIWICADLSFAHPVVESAYETFTRSRRTAVKMASLMLLSVAAALTVSTLIEIGVYGMEPGSTSGGSSPATVAPAIHNVTNGTNSSLGNNATVIVEVPPRQFRVVGPVFMGLSALFALLPMAAHHIGVHEFFQQASALVSVLSLFLGMATAGSLLVTNNIDYVCGLLCPCLIVLGVRYRWYFSFPILLCSTVIPIVVISQLVTEIQETVTTSALALMIFLIWVYVANLQEREHRDTFLALARGSVNARKAQLELGLHRGLLEMIFPPVFVSHAISVSLTRQSFVLPLGDGIAIGIKFPGVFDSVMDSNTLLSAMASPDSLMMTPPDDGESSQSFSSETGSLMAASRNAGPDGRRSGSLSTAAARTFAMENLGSNMGSGGSEFGSGGTIGVVVPIRTRWSPASVASGTKRKGNSSQRPRGIKSRAKYIETFAAAVDAITKDTPTFHRVGGIGDSMTYVTVSEESGLRFYEEATELLANVQRLFGGNVAATASAGPHLALIYGSTAPRFNCIGPSVRRAQGLLMEATPGFVGAEENVARYVENHQERYAKAQQWRVRSLGVCSMRMVKQRQMNASFSGSISPAIPVLGTGRVPDTCDRFGQSL